MTDFVSTRGPTNFPALTSGDLDQTPWPIGYTVVRGVAAASLNVGDAVYLDATGTVAKSATAADYAKALGVVVGGDSFSTVDETSFDSTLVGALAATVGQQVLIAACNGSSVVWANSAGAIVIGSRVGVGAVSGAVDDAAASNFFGLALMTGAGVSTPVKILLRAVSTA